VNYIFETIVTVRGDAGRTQVTPLGVRQQGDWVVLAPFQTLADAGPAAAVARGGDQLHRRRARVRRLHRGSARLAAGACHAVDGVRLASCLAHEEIELAEFIDHAQRPQLRCRSVHRETHAPFRGFTGLRPP